MFAPCHAQAAAKAAVPGDAHEYHIRRALNDAAYQSLQVGSLWPHVMQEIRGFPWVRLRPVPVHVAHNAMPGTSAHPAPARSTARTARTRPRAPRRAPRRAGLGAPSPADASEAGGPIARAEGARPATELPQCWAEAGWPRCKLLVGPRARSHAPAARDIQGDQSPVLQPVTDPTLSALLSV